ncbi:hypothetical protein QE390_003839 [Siphonobacter sp. SORGH_AS 1065]|nr:hypothetical protein [Siphonobacter sp. SORGH_AS_1065]
MTAITNKTDPAGGRPVYFKTNSSSPVSATQLRTNRSKKKTLATNEPESFFELKWKTVNRKTNLRIHQRFDFVGIYWDGGHHVDVAAFRNQNVVFQTDA